MAGSYRLPDEPRPGRWTHLVVNPRWPLFAVMFGGALVSWPWFVFNGWAYGSPTRVRETAIAIGGLVTTVVMIVALLLLYDAEVLPAWSAPYAMVGVTVVKLAVSYRLAFLQGRGFALYEWYGGTVRNGMMVAMAGGLLIQTQVVSALPTFWRLVLR